MFEHFDWIAAMRTSPVMVAILVLSVLTLGFAIERAIYFRQRSGNPESLMKVAMDKVRAGNLKEAEWTLANGSHPVGPVAAEVLASANLPPEASLEQLEIALGRERLLMERNLGFLGTMGNTAPLIGLLGTVWGIMRAFHDMAATGSAGPSVVAAGVAEALFTTAAGLLVAVPAVILYNYFLRRMHVMLTQAEHHARKLRLTLATSPGSESRRMREAASA
jgi:biopolymer transport protein ExbB